MRARLPGCSRHPTRRTLFSSHGGSVAGSVARSLGAIGEMFVRRQCDIRPRLVPAPGREKDPATSLPTTRQHASPSLVPTERKAPVLDLGALEDQHKCHEARKLGFPSQG